jgi:poly(3-hydroxybutyrate) depolymerase
MSRRSLHVASYGTLALGSLGLLAALAGPAFPADELLKPTEHEALGKQISAYVDATRKSSGVDKALENVVEELEKLKKRTKRDPLALTGDLGKALWASFDYEKKSSQVKARGAIKDVTFVRNPDDDPKNTLTYAIWAPAKYDSKKAYPLVLIVPETGKRPAEHIGEKWTDSSIRDGAVLVAVTMPADTAAWTEMATGDKEGGLSNVLLAYNDVRKTVAIDFDRVYLAGWGEGVRVASVLGARFPDRFAGVIGRSGDPPEDVVAENFRNLPTFFAGAGKGATTFKEKNDAAKYANCTIKPEGKESDIWAWIQDHPRMSNPTEVVLSPGGQSGNRAYWVLVPAFDKTGVAYIKANIDRGTNTVTIDGEGPTTITLHFNDQLLDLEREVKVVCNGTNHVDKIPRNVNQTLNMITNAVSDPGKLYVAFKQYDLPPKPKPKDTPK